jgi:hypothetical protein
VILFHGAYQVIGRALFINRNQFAQLTLLVILAIPPKLYIMNGHIFEHLKFLGFHILVLNRSSLFLKKLLLIRRYLGCTGLRLWLLCLDVLNPFSGLVFANVAVQLRLGDAEQFLPHAQRFDILLLKNNAFPDGFHCNVGLDFLNLQVFTLLYILLTVYPLHFLNKFFRLTD